MKQWKIWDTIKKKYETHVCVLSPRKKWGKEWGKAELERMLANTFLKLTKDETHIQEALQTTRSRV